MGCMGWVAPLRIGSGPQLRACCPWVIAIPQLEGWLSCHMVALSALQWQIYGRNRFFAASQLIISMPYPFKKLDLESSTFLSFSSYPYVDLDITCLNQGVFACFYRFPFLGTQCAGCETPLSSPFCRPAVLLFVTVVVTAISIFLVLFLVTLLLGNNYLSTLRFFA